MAVLPPKLLSTCASNVVGIYEAGPRIWVAAANRQITNDSQGDDEATIGRSSMARHRYARSPSSFLASAPRCPAANSARAGSAPRSP
jgi:hypothetical protein